MLDQKTYLAKADKSAQKPRGGHSSRPHWPFWGPLAAILDFAGGERVRLAPLGSYFIIYISLVAPEALTRHLQWQKGVYP